VLCQELLEAPALPAHCAVYWDIFQDLRFSTNANGKIPVSEVLACCNLLHIDSADDRKTILDVINGINAELDDYQLSKE